MRKFVVALALALAGVVAAAASARTQSDPQAALLERAGREALAAGDNQAAADAFGRALAVDARNPQLYLEAGTALFLLSRYHDAQEAVERALQLDPAMSRARQLLGQVLYRTGDLDGAIRSYSRVVAE